MPGGRPTHFTQSVLDKLHLAFAIGASDREACYYAGITPAALYGYQRRNPEYLEKKRLLKKRPILLARQTLVKGVEKDPKLALKFLERVKKDEFSLRTEVDVQGQIAAVFRWDGEGGALLDGEAQDAEIIEDTPQDTLPQVSEAESKIEECRSLGSCDAEPLCVGGGASAEVAKAAGVPGDCPSPSGPPLVPHIQNSDKNSEEKEGVPVSEDAPSQRPFKIKFNF